MNRHEYEAKRDRHLAEAEVWMNEEAPPEEEVRNALWALAATALATYHAERLEAMEREDR